MILIIIICGILYLFMIYGVILLYYTYKKDIEELENRLLQLEKRSRDKEVDDMACKKGRGGRKK